ncbi:MAG: hypothetical protein ACTSU5_16470 [Promethearchaeota archaeon]
MKILGAMFGSSPGWSGPDPRGSVMYDPDHFFISGEGRNILVGLVGHSMWLEKQGHFSDRDIISFKNYARGGQDRKLYELHFTRPPLFERTPPEFLKLGQEEHPIMPGHLNMLYLDGLYFNEFADLYRVKQLLSQTLDGFFEKGKYYRIIEILDNIIPEYLKE